MCAILNHWHLQNVNNQKISVQYIFLNSTYKFVLGTNASKSFHSLCHHQLWQKTLIVLVPERRTTSDSWPSIFMLISLHFSTGMWSSCSCTWLPSTQPPAMRSFINWLLDKEMIILKYKLAMMTHQKYVLSQRTLT